MGERPERSQNLKYLSARGLVHVNAKAGDGRSVSAPCTNASKTSGGTSWYPKSLSCCWTSAAENHAPRELMPATEASMAARVWAVRAGGPVRRQWGVAILQAEASQGDQWESKHTHVCAYVATRDGGSSRRQWENHFVVRRPNKNHDRARTL